MDRVVGGVSWVVQGVDTFHVAHVGHGACLSSRGGMLCHFWGTKAKWQ